MLDAGYWMLMPLESLVRDWVIGHFLMILRFSEKFTSIHIQHPETSTQYQISSVHFFGKKT
jgi:hypothetical protein